MFLVLWSDMSGIDHWVKCENKKALIEYINANGLQNDHENVSIYEVGKECRIPLFSEEERKMADFLMSTMAYATHDTKVRWEPAGLCQAPVVRMKSSITGRDENRCVLRPDVFPSLSVTSRAVTLGEISFGGFIPEYDEEEEE